MEGRAVRIRDASVVPGIPAVFESLDPRGDQLHGPVMGPVQVIEEVEPHGAAAAFRAMSRVVAECGS
jgi:hypothetical protein